MPALPLPDPTAADVGARVLAALEEGRRRHAEADAERVAAFEREVRRALDLDILAGNNQWGRAGRIAKRLRAKRRTVQKYLARLSERANSAAHDLQP